MIAAATSWQAHAWCAFSAGSLQGLIGFVSVTGLIAAWRWRTRLGERSTRPAREIGAWIRGNRWAKAARHVMLALCLLLACMVVVQVGAYVAAGKAKCGDELPHTARVFLTCWTAGLVGAGALALTSWRMATAARDPS